MAKDLASNVGVGAVPYSDIDLNPAARVVDDLEHGGRGARVVQRRAQRICDFALSGEVKSNGEVALVLEPVN